MPCSESRQREQQIERSKYITVQHTAHHSTAKGNLYTLKLITVSAPPPPHNHPAVGTAKTKMNKPYARIQSSQRVSFLNLEWVRIQSCMFCLLPGIVASPDCHLDADSSTKQDTLFFSLFHLFHCTCSICMFISLDVEVFLKKKKNRTSFCLVRLKQKTHIPPPQLFVRFDLGITPCEFRHSLFIPLRVVYVVMTRSSSSLE